MNVFIHSENSMILRNTHLSYKILINNRVNFIFLEVQNRVSFWNLWIINFILQMLFLFIVFCCYVFLMSPYITLSYFLKSILKSNIAIIVKTWILTEIKSMIVYWSNIDYLQLFLERLSFKIINNSALYTFKYIR